MKKFFILLIISICVMACEKQETDFSGIISEENFKVNSANWPIMEKDGISFKVYNPGNNDYMIIELVSGVSDYLIGQQLFSYSAAVAETGAIGKKLPTSYELDESLEKVYGPLNEFGGLIDVETELFTGLVKPGYITIQFNDKPNWSEISFHDQYRGFVMWSHGKGLSLQILDNDISRLNPDEKYQMHLFSVRCK